MRVILCEVGSEVILFERLAGDCAVLMGIFMRSSFRNCAVVQSCEEKRLRTENQAKTKNGKVNVTSFMGLSLIF